MTQKPIASKNHIMSHLEVEVRVLQAEFLSVARELKELREKQDELLEFMYRMEGGKAWFFGLITIAAGLGALFSNVAGYIVGKH